MHLQAGTELVLDKEIIKLRDMKTILISLALLIAYSAAFSQALSTVTINATGNRNRQILVDNNSYTIDNTTTTDVKELVIPNIAPGQHTLELIRNNANSNRQSTKTSFTLREGYDLTITIASNGSISTSEKRTAWQGNNGNRPLTTSQFNKLYTATKAKTSSAARATFLENEFNASARPMTAAQASQLIQLVNSESSRLKLARLSYARVSDRQNFNVVANLLNSTINRNELNNYIATIDTNNETGDTNNTTSAIDDAKFKIIYNEILAEPTVADRTYYLSNFFSRDFNYYTSAQAKQFIELVSGEQDRFTLAKAAYRGVTDRENYSIVYPLLSSSANRSALQAHINNLDNASPRVAMSPVNFDKLYNSAYNSNSSTARYTVINKAFTTAGNYFTVAQAKKLIPLVSGESNRLQLAKTSYKVLVDRSNYLQFNDFLSTTASRNDFGNYVNNYDNSSVSTTVKIAMPESTFTTLYNQVRLTFGLGAKYSALADIFNNETNYFTVAQARQLIQLVSSENNRLELAKSSYNNITDPANFTQLYDLLSTQASRNELAAYVNSNASNN